MLWLSIHLPAFALEVFAPDPAPLAVCNGAENRPLIHAANAAAIAHGVAPGQPLAAAMALCPALRTRPREPAAEQQALERLALWAQQFTSFVHLRPAEGLLLEVGGSLRLFGGPGPLLAPLCAGLEALGYTANLAAAPTPLGSWLLAREHQRQWLTGRRALERQLAALPVTALELSAEIQAALRGMGLHRLGDCFAQPRAALARRLGPELLDYLDRACGNRSDPRQPYQPAPGFEGRVLLPAEVENTAALAFAVRRLLLELAGFLRAQSAGVQQAELTLEHRGRPPTRLHIGLMRPSRDPEHLLALLRERLERVELVAPVDAIGLQAEHFHPQETAQPDLFSTNRQEADASILLEKLRARLGEGAVSGLAPSPDHRPEHAWRPAAPGQAGTPPGSQARPIGFLPRPAELPGDPTNPDRPLHQTRPIWFLPRPAELPGDPTNPDGPFHLLRGPERIESGWWDGEDAARDYFVAAGREGERLWLFRDRRNRHWFMQGLFG